MENERSIKATNHNQKTKWAIKVTTNLSTNVIQIDRSLELSNNSVNQRCKISTTAAMAPAAQQQQRILNSSNVSSTVIAYFSQQQRILHSNSPIEQCSRCKGQRTIFWPKYKRVNDLSTLNNLFSKQTEWYLLPKIALTEDLLRWKISHYWLSH